MYRDACNRGHPYVDGSYVWRSDGSRKCRICERVAREQLRRSKGVAERPLKRKALRAGTEQEHQQHDAEND